MRWFQSVSAFLIAIIVMPGLGNADVRLVHLRAANRDILVIQGSFEANDTADRLEAVVKGASPDFIAFNSVGGDLSAAMAYGRTIRRLKLSTLQVSGSKCEAECLFAFVGGVRRFAEDNSIVFDGVIPSSEPDGREQMAKKVTAYLEEMGVDPKILTFNSSSGDTKHGALSLIDMAGFGVVTGQPTSYVEPTAEETSMAYESSSASSEAAALQFFQEMQRTWSMDDGLTFLANNYGESILYYGSQRSKDDVLAEKQQFVARWPVRVYSVRPGTAHASCFNVCSVYAVVDWYAYSPGRKKSSSGTVNSVLTWDPATHKILAENGKIVATDKLVTGPDRIIRQWLNNSAACTLSFNQEACSAEQQLLTQLSSAGWCRKSDATWSICGR
ncbi:hypothetical protein ACQZ44_09580 [Agrobacterium vitis]